MSTTEEAAWYREAIRLGVATPWDAASWAAEHLNESTLHQDILLELSFMGRSSRLDTLSALHSLSKEIPAIEVLPEVLGLTYEMVRSDSGYSRDLARAFFQLYIESGYNVPPFLERLAWFDDAFDLAASGTYGTVLEVQAQLEAFVASFKHRANNRFKPTSLPPGLRPSGSAAT